MTSTPHPRQAHIITLGNEKGGAGKTTVAIHLILSLLADGHRVSSIDIDSRQRSMSHYLENRRRHMVQRDIRLSFPSHFIVNKSNHDSRERAQKDEQQRFQKCIAAASDKGDFIVIDTPGNDSYLSYLAHSNADTIITPINDSFVDLNVIAKVDNDKLRYIRPGVYAQMIMEIQKYRQSQELPNINWVVLRNRLSNIDAHNKRNMAQCLQNIQPFFDYHIAEGLSERVIYREMFLRGLSLLDIATGPSGIDMKLSHVAARQELRAFIDALHLPKPASLSNIQAISASVKETETSLA